MNRRTIRSYANRSGRMTQAQHEALIRYGEIYLLPQSTEIFDFDCLFKAQGKNIVEIGFGMGDALYQSAQENPTHRFLGIEVYTIGIGALLSKLGPQHIHHVRLVQGDAIDIIAGNLSDNSIDEFRLFFPDPWPKRKHHKRRLIQENFITLLNQKLKHRGIIHIATDWADYAKHIQQVFAVFPHLAPLDPKDFLNRAHTKYERRGERLGHEIVDMIFQKSSIR